MDISTNDQITMFGYLGLVSEEPERHLTERGREFLKVLEGIQQEEIASSQAWSAEDLVMSTSGLFR